MTAPQEWTWPRLVAVTSAKTVLVGILGLAAWGALPSLIGWHPTTVSSGSMLPRLHVGDVAVSRPLQGQVPPLSSVLLFDDPDHPGRLRMHRLVRIDQEGMLVTRGDANPADDSTPVALGAVRGVGTLRVPWIALPIVWLREGLWIRLALVAAGLGLLLVAASSGRGRGFPDDEPPEGLTEDVDTPPTPGHAPADVTSAQRTRRSGLGATARRTVAFASAALLLGALGSPADARFADTTSSTGALGTAAYFTCANAVTAFSPYLWYRLDETSSTSTTAADSSGNSRPGTYGLLGKTTTTSRACDRDSGRAMTFNGSSGYLSSRSAIGAMPNTFTLSVWFRTTTRSGGKLMGFGNAQTGASSQYDRHIYLSNSGQVYFGVYPGAVRTVSSSTTYNDGDWHLAVATLSTSGMRLYVDGSLADSDASTTTGEAGTTAYLRVAFDNLDGWDAAPTSRYFAGTLDDAAYFTTALTAKQVQALWEAGT